MKQSQPLRIETDEYASFGTARTLNSLLCFVNNERLTERFLGRLALYIENNGITNIKTGYTSSSC